MIRNLRIIAWGLSLIGLGVGRIDAGPLDPTSPLFTAHSQGDLALASGRYTFNLGTNGPTLTNASGSVVATGFLYNGINVFDFHSFQVKSGASIDVVQTTASGPIALLSSTSINVAGSIDVSGGQLVYNTSGPGNGPGATGAGIGADGQSGRAPNSGLGPGGVVFSGGGGGGFGGPGGAGQSTPIIDQSTQMQVGILAGGLGGGSSAVSLADQLRGGSMGGYGGSFYRDPIEPGGPGFGGGAIELGAVQTVSISGLIRADGSPSFAFIDTPSGSGGGGSGGGVFLHGDSVDLTGTISALGGLGERGNNVTAIGGDGGGGMVLAEYNGLNGSFHNTGNVNVGNGRFDFNSVASVPEPSSLILLGMAALCGIAATRWRSR